MRRPAMAIGFMERPTGSCPDRAEARHDDLLIARSLGADEAEQRKYRIVGRPGSGEIGNAERYVIQHETPIPFGAASVDPSGSHAGALPYYFALPAGSRKPQ